MVCPCPATLFDAWDVQRVDPEGFFLAIWVFPDEPFVLNPLLQLFAIKPVTIEAQFLNFVDDQVLLFLYNVADSRIINTWVDIAFHHRSSFVVFDVTFPSLGGHPAILAEPLLPEVPQGQVVRVCHQVLHFPPLHLL